LIVSDKNYNQKRKINMNKKILSTVISSTIALSATSIGAFAQYDDSVIEEIVVTSTKRGAIALQDIPTSITAIDQDTLTRMGAVGVEDLTRAIPALDTVDAGPGQKTYLVRGINAEGESTVAVILDNIPQVGGGDSSRRAGSNTPDFDLYDIQQVEVLRGPQGTQYGANSVAGVVRYVTNKPHFGEDEFEIETGASQYQGGDNSWNVKSLFNTVLIEDVLAFRATAGFSDSGGFIDNIVLDEENINSNERTSLRLALTWNLSENTTLLGQYFFQEIESNGRTSHTPYDWAENVGPPFMYAANGEFLGRSFSKEKAGDLKSNTPVQEPYWEEGNTFALTLDSDQDWGKVTVATSIIDRDQELNMDSSTPWMLHKRFQTTGECIRTGPCTPGAPFGGTPEAPTVPPIPPFMQFSDAATVISPTGLVLLQQAQTQKAFNFEARVASKSTGAVNYLAGFFHQEREQILDSSRVWSADPLTGEAIHDPATLMLDRNSTYTTTQDALFAEVYWDITDSLELTVGGRYFKTDQEIVGDLIVPFLRNEDIGGPIGHTDESEGESDSVYKANLAWRINEDVMVYGNYSQGFRSAGVNYKVVPDIPTFYGSDRTGNFEIGTKTSWLDGRLQVNAAAYLISWEDLQTGVNVTSQFGGLVNAKGKVAEIDGYEIELLYMAGDSLTLGLNYADINAKLTKDLVDEVGDDVVAIAEDGEVAGQKGQSLLGSPDYSGSAFAMYDFTIGDTQAFVRADVQFQSQVRNNNYSESRNTPSRSYELINIRAGFVHNENWSSALYIRNVENRVADLTVYNNFQQNDRVTPSAPRTIGFTVNYAM